MMELSGKKMLVTGAGGFIGSHLVEALVERGCRVRALVHYNSLGGWGHLDGLTASVRDQIEVVAGDVRDAYATASAVAGCDVVFHLAALIAIPYSYRAPQSYVDTNISGTLNVLEACRTHGVARLVHTSTSETYGTAQYTPIDERHPLQGQSPYSASKIGADKLAESYHRSFGLPVATIRPFNTFGPRQSARAIIPTVVSQALTGRQIRLGSLDPVRDLTFVTDTAAGFIAVASCDDAVGRVVNCGNGKGLTIGDLVNRILDLMGMRDTHRVVSEAERVRPAGSEVFRLICDNSLLGELTGWKPSVSLDDGLQRVIEYVKQHQHTYRVSVYNT
jgi:NAD dependent epimerase/dehydratase